MIDFIGNKKNYSLIKLSKCLILTNLLISFASSSYVKAATQRTPSQILPETFKEQGTIKDLDSRKQKELFPAKPVIKANQQEKIDIKFYELNLDIDFNSSRIRGSVTVNGVIGDIYPDFIELDLYDNMTVDSILHNNN